MRTSSLKIHSLIYILVGTVIFLNSCTVTNNLYVNDPVPLDKNNFSFFGGVGMGLTPSIDSISESGEVHSHSLNNSFNLVLGGRYGFTDKFNLAGSIHLPRIIGGFGADIRPQFSFFPNHTIFNMAIAGDFGFVIPKDSIKIFGSTSPLETETKGALNADISMPFSIRFGKEIRLILTPRYSFNGMFLRKELDSDKKKSMHIKYPAFSAGLKLKRIFLESSMIYWDSEPIFVFGIAYLFGDNKSYKENTTSLQ